MENTLSKWTCQHCNLEFELSACNKPNHIRWCEKNPVRKRRKVKKCEKCDKDAKPRSLYCKDCGGLQKHTPETKKILSEKRKEWLKENPDKHVWKRHSKFKSVPCEKLKEFVLSKNIKFLPEFTPLTDRAFAVDVAFPEKMVCLEINGNQHYDAIGKLKPYYQEKHDLVTAAGWKVLEIHYSLCFNAEYISSLLNTIANLPVLNDFDYDVWENGRSVGVPSRNVALEERSDMQFHHRPMDKFQYDVYIPINKKKEQKKCKDCDKNIAQLSIRCKTCANIHNNASRKIQLPEKEQLQEMVNNTPLSKLGPQFGLSDVGLKKRCIGMGIIIPNNSYRRAKSIESIGCNKAPNGRFQ
jgi:hypothetical protein